MSNHHEIRHFHLFCGLGGGAAGFNRGQARVGPMHRTPRLQWRTWVRLAFVEAGKDWRSLERLRVRDGVLADYLILPLGHYRNDIAQWCARSVATGASN